MNPPLFLANRTPRGGGHHARGLAQLPREVAHEAEALRRQLREGRFQRSLAVIAGLSSLLSGLEVAYEHYRGSYSQRVMYSPVFLGLALLIAGIWGAVSRRAARTVLPLVSLLVLIDGAVGFCFHLRGIARKPGGWRLPVFNLIMGPPIFAPLLFGLSGYLGLLAAALRRGDERGTPRPGWPHARRARPSRLPGGIASLEATVREGRFQRQLAAATAISALFSGFEALYSHYKNGFKYKAQWTPVLLTPILCAAGIGAIWSGKIARTLLPVASVLALIDGGIGFGYHLRGMLRRPGGLKLPLHNLIYGPPIFAPLLFAASGFLGLLASLLRREE